MELKIYDKQGIVKMTVSPDNSSQWNHEVGVENVVTVNFTTWEFLVLEVGWYILVEGHRFSIKSEYRPKHIHNSKYTYNLKFYGREHDTQDILFCRLNQGEDDLESVFAYDGTPMDFLNKVVANMNRNSDGVVWKAGEAITANRQTINFNGLYCWDALGEIARTFGTEWWIDGEYVNLSKCIRGESVLLGYGEGLKSGLTQNENTNAVKWFTRLIPVGSTKNIDKSKYGYANLQLPGREKYIDINTQYGLKEYREESAFSEIYPHRVGTISSVRSEERTNEETGNYTVYYVKDSFLPFNPDDYMIGGEVIHMSFNTGALAGKEFEVNWNNDTKEFEIINQYPDENTQLPGGNLVPSADDTYVLWNISMPDEYIRAAEKEYKEAVDAYLAEYSKDVSIYSGNTDYIYVTKNNVPLLLGQRVRLISEQYFDEGSRESRITRVSRKLNNIGEASIDCSDAIASSWKTSVDSSLNQLQFAAVNKEVQSLIQILKTGDSNLPSDYNVFSALRSLNTFLRKDKDDRSKGKISTDKAIEVGKFVAGASGAIIQVDKNTGQTIAELDKLYVRMKAYFETLEIINVNSIGGKMILSPAGSVTCLGVEELEDDYRCYFLGEQDGDVVENRWQAGMQAYSQMFNAKEGVSNKVSNVYYWRLVTGVSEETVEYNNQKCHYIDLSKTDRDYNVNEEGEIIFDSDIPKAGDVINHRGARTDTDYMNFIEFSSVGTNAPYITLFQGVNSYSLVGKDYVQFGYDQATGKAFMNVYGDMYVGDRDESSYMRYTEEGGLEIKGKLSVGTTLGGKDLQEMINAASPEGYQEFVDKVTKDLAGLQNQIDGAIESYFYQYIPTLENYPAMEWTTDAKKEAHLNDTFTNLADGRSWRWTVAEDGTYGWTEITDTATAQALALAGEAQDTADGKRRVFTDTPYPPYDLGDLWAGGADSYLMKCVVAKSSGEYDAADWDYADNTSQIKKEVATFDYLKAALKEDTTIDGGLIQSSLLQLGYTDTVFRVMSGTNGVYNADSHGGGVASWWGGGLHDLLDYYTWSGQWIAKVGVTIPDNIPSGLIRMDGTGYFAKGKFWWDADGEIHADPTALLLSFDMETGDETLAATIINIRKELALFRSMWEVRSDSEGNEYLYSNRALATNGGITAYANVGDLDIPGIYDGLPVDGSSIYWENGVLKAKGSSGVASSVDWENVEGKPSWIGASKPSYAWSEITGKPSFASVATSGKYSDLSGAPTLLSSFNNDLGFIDSSALSGYLPLSGGSVEGTLTVRSDRGWGYLFNVIRIDSGVYNVGIGFHNNSGTLGYIGVCGSAGLYPGQPLFVNNAGENYQIWHSGNDGADNGLDADLLDGLQPSELSVLSASKLATARTIWGQSFDGTGNVSGALSGATTGAFSSNVTIGGALGVTGAATLKSTLSVASDTTLATKLTLNGIPIYKSQDDVLYIDGNLAVRGGITMYATDAIDVESIIDSLPVASTSAKGIASFNSSDFSVVDGYVSLVVSTGGIDLSDYLPLSGGQMTGNIGYTLDADNYFVGIPAAGSFDYSISLDSDGVLNNKKSFIGSVFNTTTSVWYNMISIRHQNGYADGNKYGMYISCALTSNDSLAWNRQRNGSWDGERVILDNQNWSNYISLQGEGNFISTSGGEISNSATGLFINRTMANANPHITFKSQGTAIGDIGVSASNMMPAFYSYNKRAWEMIWCESNFNPDDYMPVESPVCSDLLINGINSRGSYPSLTFHITNTNWAQFIMGGDGIIELRDGASQSGSFKSLKVADLSTYSSPGIHVYRDSGVPYIRFYSSNVNVGELGFRSNGVLSNWNFNSSAWCTVAVFDVSGNLLSPGGMTMYSDIRKKTKLKDVELSLKQIADAPLIEHYYNSDEKKTTHVGSIAQYWARMNDWFCKLDNEGYYTMEIQNAALASAISIARHLQKYENKTDRKIRMLKERVKELENKIEKLEKKGA